MSRPSRFELVLDPDTKTALQRLALAEDRSMGSVVRLLVRQAAISRGLWTPQAPSLVPARKNTGTNT